MQRSLSGIAALLLIVLPGAVAAEVANLLEPYTVTAARTLNSDCAIDRFDDPRIAEFERGVCLFHKEARSEAETGVALDELRQAQKKGLPPVHQNFAALLDGLMSCQQAQSDLARYKASNNKSEMEQLRFCRNRRIALADLGEIRWDRAYFDYESSPQPGFNLSARLTEMGICHATVLDPAFDAECGLVSNISDTEIASFVNEAMKKVIEKYFAGPTSPISAMFGRKVERSKGLRESAGKAMDGLSAGAAEVNGEYDALNAAYVAAKDGKIAKAYGDYRDAILRANSILDEFNRWKDGLFITADNKDLKLPITDRMKETTGELERIQQLGFATTSASLVGRVRRIIDSKAETVKITAQLCRIYYCELANRRSLPKTIRACRKPGLANNPLCVEQDESLRSGTLSVSFEGTKTVDVQDLCRSVGVENPSTIIGMGPQSKTSCLAQMP